MGVLTVDKLFGVDSWSPDQPSPIIDMSTRSVDLEPSQFGVGNNDEKLSRIPPYFQIIPEVDAGEIKVQLINQTGTQYFIFTAAQLAVYIGQALPFLIKKVYKTGTTATFSIFW
jgi:hypothetical protein